MTRVIRCIVIGVLLIGQNLFADVESRNEQLIVSMAAFNGKDYSRSFSRETERAIYLIANENNFLSLRKTYVYYWPLSGDWLLDTDTLNVQMHGTLQIRDKSNNLLEYQQQEYSVFNAPGEYEINWEVAIGEEANKIYREYIGVIDTFVTESRRYDRAVLEYEATLERMTSEIVDLRESGLEYEDKLAEMQKLEEPVPPEPMSEYLVPPSVPVLSFIVNLPAGNYEMRMVDDAGSVMEGSEKQLTVFESGRAGMGYEVIPSDKWTRPAESNKPGAVIYTDGSTEIFTQPFYQSEFNDLYYNRMISRSGRGNPSLMKWVRIQQIPGAQIKITRRSGAVETVREGPFYVEQLSGSALGYNIVPFKPEDAERGKLPTLFAFALPRVESSDGVSLIASDRSGNLIPESKRQVRIVQESSAEVLLFVLALLPLVTMLVVIVLRSRRYKPRVE